MRCVDCRLCTVWDQANVACVCKGKGTLVLVALLCCAQSVGEEDDMDWHKELRTAIAAEQEADAAMVGGGGMAGFKPSASSAWRDSDFQQGLQYGDYTQPDINDQGWLPR